MKAEIIGLISSQLQIRSSQVKNTLELLEEGATIPFISRYRKERTGSLDEVAIGEIREHFEKLTTLEKRKETILKSMEESGVLTDELRSRIGDCYNSAELEDIYLPFKPKRRTRATIARENGLEALARMMMAQTYKDPEIQALKFLGDKVPDTGEALSGARDIIAEWISENEHARNRIREIFDRTATIRSSVIKGKEEEGIKFKDYFSWEESLRKAPSHRVLAMRRGENEGFLRVSIDPDKELALETLNRMFVKGKGGSSDQVILAVKESFNRLIAPSIETEFAHLSKEKADKEAIAVFAGNLRQLLLAPPLGPRRILAIDPGYRTGCKVVCLNAQGDPVHNETIYPHPPREDRKMAAKKLTSMVEAYEIEAIAIGNGTASRETETFIKNLHYDRELKVFVVSEDGASVYSASSLAREEFPGYDVTVRGAISIGRRLMDPLAELVKIDPKSIGVGQYQHDVDQKMLKNSLDMVVESVVNTVGVNVNTASKEILTHISGLGPQLAQNIVDYRQENGPFKSRDALCKVPRMGNKSFQQSAGFLRVPESENPLDNSAVHPESYVIAVKMAADLDCSLTGLIGQEKMIEKIDLTRYVSQEAGLPTLQDIRDELAKPGRDPRKMIRVFEFAPGIFSMDHLRPGMILPGIVNNITNFGIFVDIGVKQSGLVHLSEMANRFVSNPNEIVKLHQHVHVKVLEVDIARKRIQLSLKQAMTAQEKGVTGNPA
jgi:uncharacterized protein